MIQLPLDNLSELSIYDGEYRIIFSETFIISSDNFKIKKLGNFDLELTFEEKENEPGKVEIIPVQDNPQLASINKNFKPADPYLMGEWSARKENYRLKPIQKMKAPRRNMTVPQKTV